jgi:nitrogen regulatory protein PII
MKTLIIVARDSMVSDLENLLQENGVKAYTIMSNVMGKGVSGRVFGTFLNPDTNAIIFAVLPPEQAGQAIHALQALHATRKAASQDTPIPLKVFSFPCEEHV